MNKLKQIKQPVKPSKEELDTIIKYACGDDTLHYDALSIYRKFLGNGHNCVEFDFMHEVDHPLPDYSLKEIYRKRIQENGN